MKSDKPRILIVEDDEGIMLGLEENLRSAGYEVLTASDGTKALSLAMDAVPDLIILDIMLPGMSGFEVCRELRAKGRSTPIVMLTARQDEFDKLHGFETGADDYVTKPFSIKELMARVKAILQRGRIPETGVRVYDFGDCLLDLESRVCTRKGKELVLTRTEFDLLAYFCRNEGKAMSREQVMQDVWGMQYFGTQRSLDSFVASLRAKIEAKPAQPKHILTVRGVGYKFVK